MQFMLSVNNDLGLHLMFDRRREKVLQLIPKLLVLPSASCALFTFFEAASNVSRQRWSLCSTSSLMKHQRSLKASVRYNSVLELFDKRESRLLEMSSGSPIHPQSGWKHCPAWVRTYNSACDSCTGLVEVF